MSYNYIDGKQRVISILNSTIEIVEKKSIPQNDAEWTYANGIKTWISAIFVDLRDSSNFLHNGDEIEVYCKSDTVDTILSISTLNITLGGSL